MRRATALGSLPRSSRSDFTISATRSAKDVSGYHPNSRVALDASPEQRVDLGWTEVASIDFDHHPTGGGIDAHFVVAVALPDDGATHLRESELDEFADAEWLSPVAST